MHYSENEIEINGATDRDSGSIGSSGHAVSHSKVEDNDFVAWVESHDYSRISSATPPLPPAHNDDTESVKSKLIFLEFFKFFEN